MVALMVRIDWSELSELALLDVAKVLVPEPLGQLVIAAKGDGRGREKSSLGLADSIWIAQFQCLLKFLPGFEDQFWPGVTHRCSARAWSWGAATRSNR